MSNSLIEVKDLKVYFKQKSPKLLSFKPGILKAVDQVSFSIEKGKTFGLVGESGSGKSTIGKAILRYQDPYSSLDPSHTVQDIICEPMEIHKLYTPKERKERAKELIRVVGLKEQDLLKYPHEFSGGQRQRISIARALSVQPEFVVCDEPISALDVSLQAQIVQMLQDLQEKYGLTYLFISHQLQVVQKICDEIGVLYLGNLMEIADADKLYSNPLHPYTKMLISSIPVPDPRVKTLDQIVTDTGVQSRSIGGCRFHNRCPWCEERCRQEVPLLREAESGHLVACHKY